VILATYLPIFRAHELQVFQKNVELLRPDQVVVCVDYFFDERQHDMLRPYLPPGASLIVGNWRNRTSCLLRLVDIIAKEGDGLVVDSDAVLAGDFPDIDRKVEEPMYHVAESPWRHRRVVRMERRGGVDVYYWRLKALWSRYIQVFVGPKRRLNIKPRRQLPIRLRSVHILHHAIHQTAPVRLDHINPLDPRNSRSRPALTSGGTPSLSRTRSGASGSS